MLYALVLLLIWILVCIVIFNKEFAGVEKRNPLTLSQEDFNKMSGMKRLPLQLLKSNKEYRIGEQHYIYEKPIRLRSLLGFIYSSTEYDESESYYDSEDYYMPKESDLDSDSDIDSLNRKVIADYLELRNKQMQTVAPSKVIARRLDKRKRLKRRRNILRRMRRRRNRTVSIRERLSLREDQRRQSVDPTQRPAHIDPAQFYHSNCNCQQQGQTCCQEQTERTVPTQTPVAADHYYRNVYGMYQQQHRTQSAYDRQQQTEDQQHRPTPGNQTPKRRNSCFADIAETQWTYPPRPLPTISSSTYSPTQVHSSSTPPVFPSRQTISLHIEGWAKVKQMFENCTQAQNSTPQPTQNVGTIRLWQGFRPKAVFIRTRPRPDVPTTTTQCPTTTITTSPTEGSTIQPERIKLRESLDNVFNRIREMKKQQNGQT